MSDPRTETQSALPGWSILLFALVMGGLEGGYAIFLTQTAPTTSALTFVASVAASGVIGGALGWWVCILLPGKSTPWQDVLAGVVSFLAGSLAFAVCFMVIGAPHFSGGIVSQLMDVWLITMMFTVLIPMYWGALIIPFLWAFLCGSALRGAQRSRRVMRGEA